MKKIMVATDVSERSDRVLRHAVIVALAHDIVLEVSGYRGPTGPERSAMGVLAIPPDAP
jgi:nucleotide-binding universal stress UspA family protein